VDGLAARADPLTPGALIMIDLDEFGAVNKRHGHAAGDALLAGLPDATRRD